MAGLGQNISNEHTLLSLMNGESTVGGEPVFLWYFGNSFTSKGFMGDRYLPSEHLECVEGETVQIFFQNMSGMPHTIHLHGLDVDQANDGVPATSQAVEPLQSFTYEFVAPHAGTYHYHCHVDTVVHYHRGMSGTIIVRPPDGSTNTAWSGGPAFDEEVLWHLHTFDTSWATVSESNEQTAVHQPNVFMLNGKEAAEALDDVPTRVAMLTGEQAYIRVVNCAYQWARVDLDGRAFTVVASDGRPMAEPQTATTWDVGPGERYDLLFSSETAVDALATISYLDDYSGDVLGTVATRIIVG